MGERVLRDSKHLFGSRLGVLERRAHARLQEMLHVSHFRNLCQHSSMGLLESVFQYLIKKINQLVKSVEAEHGTEKLIYLLSESEKASEQAVPHIQESDATAEELVLLANCDLEEIEENLARGDRTKWLPPASSTSSPAGD